ncbi:MAG: permease [bacterium]
MKIIAKQAQRIGRKTLLLWVGASALAVAASMFPEQALETALFAAQSLVNVAPLVIPGIILAAWISASGVGGRIAEAFNGHVAKTVIVASAIGAVTPVCGVTVLPLMAGLLAAGVPLAPVMAFWLSSPVTDPAMLATTAATLGVSFAVGKTAAAFALGLLGGGVTALLRARAWVRSALRDNALVRGMGQCPSVEIRLAVWKSPQARAHFQREFIAICRLVLICLLPAFAAEHVLNGLLQPHALSAYVGEGNWWAVPFAVFVGAPVYLDGFAALPLVRSLMNHGMSAGAAMAFLVSGGVVSVWGALAILPVLRVKPFLLYLALAVVGSLISGWVFEIFT